MPFFMSSSKAARKRAGIIGIALEPDKRYDRRIRLSDSMKRP
jgi:hypothetical protein